MRTRRVLAVAVGVMLAMRAAAQPAAPPMPARSMLLELCLNDACHGIALVQLREDGLWVERTALQAAGLRADTAPVLRIGQRELLPLDTFKRLEVTVDEISGRLQLRQAAADMPHREIDVASRAEADAVAWPWSGFANYALGVGEGGDRNGYFDASFGRGHAALRSTALWTGTRGWQRGFTRIELDRPSELQRWTVGDQIAAARDPLGGGALLGGVGVERAFEQDPYLVTAPQPFYHGVLQTPGTVEVYSNGVLVARHEVGAGPFTLKGLGLAAGRNDVNIVVVDPFGNRRPFSDTRFYGSSHALAPDLVEYGFHLGAVREGGGLGGGYGNAPAMQGWRREGVNDRWTVGGRFEADADFANAGGDAVWRSPVGEWNFAVARSRNWHAGSGRALALGYSYAAPRAGVSLGVRRFDAKYRSLGQSDLFGRVLREDDHLSAAWTPNSRVAWQLNLGRRRYESESGERTLGLTATLRLAPQAQLHASVQRTQAVGLRDTTALVSLNLPLDRGSVDLSARRNEAAGVAHDGFGFDASRSRPPDTGWGYQVSGQRFDDIATGFAQVEYQGRFGRIAWQGEKFDSQRRDRLLLSGALTGIGGRLFATPPLESGFALVRVPQAAGVPILRENTPVGHTDAHGDLLVRELLPFYPSQLALDARALPVDFKVISPQRRAAVPRNTGALVALDVRPLHAVTGQVRLDDGTGDTAAEYGVMQLTRLASSTAEEAARDVLLGSRGRYYVEDLPAGRYAVHVESATRTAVCTLEVPASTSSGVLDLGALTCKAATKKDLQH